MKTIVVGVDGSKHAEDALEFAAEEASLRGARLLIVCAWESSAMIAPMGAGYTAEFLEAFIDSAESIVRAAVARVAELQPSVACEGKSAQGHPAEVLLKEAEQADMIVVGNRGHGEFVGLLLGSVTQHVVHHAHCPVVVVR